MPSESKDDGSPVKQRALPSEEPAQAPVASMASDSKVDEDSKVPDEVKQPLQGTSSNGPLEVIQPSTTSAALQPSSETETASSAQTGNTAGGISSSQSAAAEEQPSGNNGTMKPSEPSTTVGAPQQAPAHRDPQPIGRRLSLSQLLDGSPAPSSGQGILGVSALAAQLCAQFAAPRLSSSGPVDLATLQRMYPGWTEATAATGVLGLTQRQLMRRLCIGRPEATADKLQLLVRAFLHVCGGGGPSDFDLADPSKDRKDASAVLATVPVAKVRVVLQCVGRSEGMARDDESLSRLSHILELEAGTDGPSGAAGTSAMGLGATLLEFLSCFGHVAEEANIGTSVRAVASLVRMYAPFDGALGALQAVHGIVDNTIAHDKDSSQWCVASTAEAVQTRLARVQHGYDLLRAAGFDDVSLPDGRRVFLLDEAHDSRGQPSVQALPQAVKDKLMKARAELEAELEVMDGAPTVSRTFRELQSAVIAVDSAGQAAWLGKLLIAGRMLLRYATNVLANPGEARNWRVNPSNPVFTEKIRVLGDGPAARLMACIAFDHVGDYYILRGTKEHDPAGKVTPVFPGAPTASTATFSFPSLPSEVLSLLVRRRSDVEGVLMRLEGALTAMGHAPPPEPLMAAVAQVQPASSQPAAPAATGAATAGAAKADRSAKPPAAPGKPGAAAPAPQPTDPLLNVSAAVPEASLVIPILMRASMMPPEGVPAGGAAGAGAAAKAPAAKAPAGKASPAAAGAAMPAVNATDARYATQLAQLRYLKLAFTRLDTRGTGMVTVADLRAAFAAEARPARDRTEEALAAWIASRDLNKDGAVSWPEFAASFAPLFLPPTSGAPAQAAEPAAAPKAAAATPAKAGAKDAPKAATGLNAADTAAALSLARSGLQGELHVIMSTAVAQLQSVLKTGLASGYSVDATAGTILALPWASAVLDVLSGMGLLLLFSDRYAVRNMLAGWTAHVTALVSDRSNAKLWKFRVTLPHETSSAGDSALSLASSMSYRDHAVSATVPADASRATDMTLAWDVARLPGMQLLLRALGYQPIFDAKAKRDGVPVEYRLAGVQSSSWQQLPEAELPLLSACAQVLARHAVIFEAEEAADPVVMLLGVASVLAGGQLPQTLRTLAAHVPSSAPASGAAAAGAGAAKAAAAPPKAPAAKGAAAAAPGSAGSPGDPFFDSILDTTTGSKWQAGLDVVYKYLGNVSKSPADLTFRRINTSNPAFQQKLVNLPCPRAVSGYQAEGDLRHELPTVWHGVRTLTAVGFREARDGSLILPPVASLQTINTRLLELSAVMPLLGSVDRLAHANAKAASSLLGPAPIQATLAATSGTSGQDTLVAPPRLPTTLLSTLLDPRTALTRRYSESNALRGNERLVSLDSSLDSRMASAATAPLSSTAVGSSDGLVTGFRPAGLPLHKGAASTGHWPAAAVTGAAGAADSRRTSVAQGGSSSAPATPARPGAAGATTKRAPAATAAAGAKGKPTPSGATTPSSSGADTPKDKAQALIALGPAQAGEAMARLLEETEKVKADAKAREASLEAELQELRAQVKSHQVADLVPIVKESLGVLEKGSTARQSAVAAAAGLGLKISDGTAKAKVTRGRSPSRGRSPGKKGKSPKKSKSPKKGTASAKSALTKNPVVIHSCMRLASPLLEGANSNEIFVKAKPEDIEGGPPQEVIERFQTGEVFVPPQCLLQAGDYIMVNSDVNAELAFIRKIVPAHECDRPEDEYKVILDRNFNRAHAEEAFVTVQTAPAEWRAKFYRNEITGWLRGEFIHEIISHCAQEGERAVRLRAAEAKYLHRTVTRRVPVGIQLYGDVAEALVKVQPGHRAGKAPFDPNAGLMFALGPMLGVPHSGAPRGSRPPVGLGPVTGYASVGSVWATAEMFGHVFDLLDYGAQGHIKFNTLLDRMRRDTTAWSAVCSDAVLPLEPADAEHTGTFLPTAHQVWQRLMLLPTLHQELVGSDAEASDPTITRHAFSALFRCLHPLDIAVAGKGASQAVLSSVHWNDAEKLLADAASVEYWGTQWDTARAAAPLITEEQLGDVALAFASLHAAEQLYTDGVWCATGPNNPLQKDPRFPPPTAWLTFKSVRELCMMLDGDAPTEAELHAYAAALHRETIAARKRELRRLRGEAEDEADADDDDDASIAEASDVDEDENGQSAVRMPAIPPEPFPGLAFDDVVHLRAVRDGKLLKMAPATLKSSLPSTVVPVVESMDVLTKGQKADVLAAERRRAFPSPGLARLQHVLRLLRTAFADVRKTLVRNITLAVEGKDSTSRSVSAGPSRSNLATTATSSASIGRAALGLDEAQVEERVASIAASDLIAFMQRTDEGRRLLSFPLAIPGSTGAVAGPGSGFVTVQSLLEYLSKASSSGHVTWAQISAGVSTCGRVVSAVPAASSLSASPAPIIPLPSIAAAALAQHSLVPVPVQTDITLVDVLADHAANVLCVLTSDGSLVGYDGSTLNRKWAVTALHPKAAHAIAWLRQTHCPHARPLVAAMSSQPRATADRSVLNSVSTEVQSTAMVNSSLASLALRLCTALEPARVGAFTDVTDPHGLKWRSVAWRANIGSGGHAVAQVQPRIVLDSTLVTFVTEPGSDMPLQVLTNIQGGTHMLLMECLHLADSHLMIASCVPDNEAVLMEVLSTVGRGTSGSSAHAVWPRLMTFDALTGACVGDLGHMRTGLSTGVHLQYNSFAGHVLAADSLPQYSADGRSLLGCAPVVKVWDVSALAAVTARQRAAFLHAAVSPASAAAASSAMQHTTGAAGMDGTSISATGTTKAGDGKGGEGAQQPSSADSVILDDEVDRLDDDLQSFQSGDEAGVPANGVPASAQEFVPQVVTLPHVAMLDVTSQLQGDASRYGGVAPFQPGQAVVQMTSLPNSGLLAVAQADGTVTVWDTRHQRQRLHYPPTSTITDEDYGYGYVGGAGVHAMMDASDDARFTRVPAGMHMNTTLKLACYYAPGGVMATPVGGAAEAVGRLVKGHSVSSASKPAAIRPIDVRVGMAVVPGGPSGLLSMSRLPCRVRTTVAQAGQAADVATALATVFLSSKRNLAAEDDRDLLSGLGTTGPSGSSTTASPRGHLHAGYFYIMDDGTVSVLEAPALQPALNRPLPVDAVSRLFDQRLVELTDEVFLLAGAAADMASEYYTVLKKVILQRHRVQRVLFVVSKGVPLASLLPCLTKAVILAGNGTRAVAGAAGVTLPVAAAPLATVAQQMALMHDNVQGAAGAATTAVPHIMSLATSSVEASTASPPVQANAVVSLPFVVLPFYTPSDNPSGVMIMRRGGTYVSPEPFNGLEAVVQGKYWTTGIVVAVDGEGGLTVALDHDDRVMHVNAKTVLVIANSTGVALPPGTARPAEAGDHVRLSVRTAITDATLGPTITLHIDDEAHLVFPPDITVEAPQPGLDLLALQVDQSYEPQTVGQGVDMGDDGPQDRGTVMAALVKRHVLLWTLGRAEASVHVQTYDDDLPADTTAAMTAAFARHAHGALLRTQSYWGMQRMTGVRGAATRNEIILQRARELYMAANTGGGAKSTAAALYRGITATAAAQADVVTPFTRGAIQYMWALRGLLAEAEAANGVGSAAMDPTKVSLGDWLCMMAAAAWHYPMFRHAFRHLMSVDGKGVEQAQGQMDDRWAIFHSASAAMGSYKRFLLAEGGSSGGEGGGTTLKLTLRGVMDAAASTMHESYTMDTLLGMLEYLRDAAGSANSLEGAPPEHMLQSLIRRHALPWDPPALLSMGIADGATVDAITDAAVVATPIEAYIPGEVAFLLANGPTVTAISEPALQALARAFADPSAAIRTTLSVIQHVMDRQHIRASLPESALLDPSGDPLVLSARDLDFMFEGLFSVARLGKAVAKLEEGMAGTPLTQLAAHGKLVSMASHMLSDTVVPKAAASIKAALQHVRPPKRRRTKAKSGQAGTEVDSDDARKAAIDELQDKVYVLLADAPVSMSPEGADPTWTAEYAAAAREFSRLVVLSANEAPAMSVTKTETALAAAEHRSILYLLKLLSHGCVEAMVHAAIIHVNGALRVPTIHRDAGAAPAVQMLQALGRILNLFDNDGSDAARRLAAHLPRLMRAFVYISSGRLDVIPDDVPPDTTRTPPVVHPIDTRMLSPAYVAAVHSTAVPMITRLMGVDGRGSPVYPAICRYVAACSTPACLARGPAVMEAHQSNSASPLLPIAASPFIAPYDGFFTGLARAATADDMACKTVSGNAGRRVIAWTFEESVEQFARRHKPAAPITGQVSADIAAMASEHESRSRTRAAIASGALSEDIAARQDASDMATIMKLAGSGTSHMLSPFSAFRRGQSYWRQLGPMLTAVERLHAGMPDPISDVTTDDGAGGEAVVIHARLMERVTARRMAVSRFRMSLRPPAAYTAGVRSLESEVESDGGRSGSDAVESEMDDIDRSLLATDFQVPDLLVALMHDSDAEVRAFAFRAIRTACVAIAGPLMDTEGDVLNELAADSRSMSSFAARVRNRRWNDLLHRFSAMDCTVAAVRRMVPYATWTKAAVHTTANPAPESHEVVSMGVDILTAQAAARTAQPGVWRTAGVLGCLARLSQVCLPKPQKKDKPGPAGAAGKAAAKAANKDFATMLKGRMSAAVGSVLPDVTTADALLRRVCTDHGFDTMMALVRFDHSARQWAQEHGVDIHEDNAGSWDAVTSFLSRAMSTLDGSHGLDQLASAMAGPAGERQAALQVETAQTLDHVFSSVTARFTSLKRALMLELETVIKGTCSRLADVQVVISSIWTLFDTAWHCCMCSHPDHPVRGPAQALLHAILTLTVDGIKRGMVQGCILLGCPLEEDLATGHWAGLGAMVKATGDTIVLHVYEPDAARLVQSRATYIAADAMTRALDIVLMPVTVGSTDLVGQRRAAVDRRFAITLLAQAADLDPVAAYLSQLKDIARLVQETTAVKALSSHTGHMSGQPFSLGIHARGLLWTAITRAACIQAPPRAKVEAAGAAASGAGDVTSGPAKVPGISADTLFRLAQAYTERLVVNDAFRVIIATTLPVLSLIDGSNSLPRALAPFANTYCVRMEGVSSLFVASSMVLQLQARLAVQAHGSALDQGSGEGAGADPKAVDAGATLLNITLSGGAETDMWSPKALTITSPLAAGGVEADDDTLLRSYSQLLKLLQEHVAKVVVADGVLAAERTRLWKCKDLALAPSVCIVLHSILQLCPRDEVIRRGLDDLAMPKEAVEWYRAARRMFAAHASADVTVSTAQAKARYLQAEKAGVAAWLRWRQSRFQVAPTALESEAVRPLAKNAPLPSSVSAAVEVATMLNLTGRMIGGNSATAQLGGSVLDRSSLSVASAGAMRTSERVGPPSVPTSGTSRPLSAGHGRTVSFGPQGGPVDATLTGTTRAPSSHGLPTHGRAPSNFTVRKPEGGPALAAVQDGKARPTGQTGADLLSSAARRMHSDSDTRAVRRSSISSPAGSTSGLKARKAEAVAATAGVLVALGEAVVDVKAAFDSIARPVGKKGEPVVSCSDSGLGALCRGLGFAFPADMLDRLATEGIVPPAPSSPTMPMPTLPFSGVLRVIGRLMDMYGVSVPPSVGRAGANVATNGVPSAPSSRRASTAAPSRSAVPAPAPPVPSPANGAPVFKADLAVKLALPSVPVPQELLKSIFERFSSAKTVLVQNDEPGDINGPPRPGQATVRTGKAGSSSPAVLQTTVRGIQFVSWPTALAAAGQPVSPSEARELYRYCGLALAELADFSTLLKAYAAIAGFRWLSGSGLLSAGSDMMEVAQAVDVPLVDLSRLSGRGQGHVSGVQGQDDGEGSVASDLSDGEGGSRPVLAGLSPDRSVLSAGYQAQSHAVEHEEEDGAVSPLTPGHEAAGGAGGDGHGVAVPRMQPLDSSTTSLGSVRRTGTGTGAGPAMGRR